MKSSRFAKSAASILALSLAALTLTGCTDQARWQKGTGPIKIVASTNVWGDIAYQIAGDQATVTALIDNVNGRAGFGGACSQRVPNGMCAREVRK
mgnify:CR=1 FL=1